MAATDMLLDVHAGAAGACRAQTLLALFTAACVFLHVIHYYKPPGRHWHWPSQVVAGREFFFFKAHQTSMSPRAAPSRKSVFRPGAGLRQAHR